MYACIAINGTRLVPKLPNEVTAVGDSLPLIDEKHKRISWEVWHDGHPFTGLMQLFGRLVWFKNMDDKKNKMHPKADLFLGWQDCGCVA